MVGTHGNPFHPKKCMIDIQTALTPLVFVSGMSLFLLVLTNRFQVLTTRARSHVKEHHTRQVHRFRIRIRLMRASIMSATISVIFALALVAVMLSFAITMENVARIMLIVASMAVISAVLFLVDVSKAAEGTLEILAEHDHP